MYMTPYPQVLVAERVRHQPCIRRIAGSFPVHGHFATPFSKEFNLLTRAVIATPRWPGELPGTICEVASSSLLAQMVLAD